MKNLKEIEAILVRVSVLLRLGGKDEWADRIDDYQMLLARDAPNGISKIIGLYGGMGSINDIVLYRKGQPLIKENNELDQLLSRLHELCVNA
jgi:hypothetical protein